jgi:hypothetical protein
MSLNWYRTRLQNVDPQHQKAWHAERGKYVVRWRDNFLDVNVPAGYQALYQIRLPDGRVILDLVWRYKVFNTRKAAFAACEDRANGLNPAKEFKLRKLERKLKRRRKSKKVKLAPAVLDPTLPLAPEKKQRKPRSDKGKPRKLKETLENLRKFEEASKNVEILINQPPIEIGKKRKQRSDKGKKRGSRNSPNSSDA